MATQEPTSETPSFQPRRPSLAAGYVCWLLSERVLVTPSGCWEWQGRRQRQGYGTVDLRKHSWPERVVMVHRLVYSICVEAIPDGLDVLHRCDNPPCCRPDHLFLGSNLDNVADKVAKGRHRSPSGEAHGMARMTAELVMSVRRRAAAGESYASIARDIGFSATQVSDVARGKVWQHLPFPEAHL